MQALSIAATGMMAQQLNVEVISNNIANMSTTGFKRQRAEFQDLLYQNLRRVGTNSSDTGTIVPSGVQIGLGVKTGSVYRIMNQGDMNNTGNKLDVAIQGRGYLRVELPSGEDAYTRAGNLSLSATGQIVTSDGYTVQPGITIPTEATDITINKDGQVQATIPGQTAPQVVGQLDLATFANEAGLDPQGDNLFLETAASGAPSVGTPGSTGYGTLLQGFLETSNVNAVTEISDLITAQRAYEMNSKVITAADEMMSVTSNLK
ncbi:flagellar basal-body rod protein FlgG [Parvibaculum sp.]|uniref:flagellar basal-body rod protein FlgG n=1 Tax=Parvibaculum sp. TaxID=2024848 RepID=UPI002B7E9D64|nr:flagellar basal-body rod protein FlgG [Parvibaculum sp.]HUD51035.1 flagellar basal-body rod protein FlgG [Parvibaculum sp.]